MSEQNTPDPTPTYDDATYARPDVSDEPGVAPKPRFQDRVLGMRAVAGVALASVVLGGAGGAALGAISNGADDGAGGRFGGPMTNLQGPFGQQGGQSNIQQGRTQQGSPQGGPQQFGQQGSRQGGTPMLPPGMSSLPGQGMPALPAPPGTSDESADS